MIRYEISYEVNGVSGQMFVVADSDEAALAKFAAEWSISGDKPPPSPWISGRNGTSV